MRVTAMLVPMDLVVGVTVGNGNIMQARIPPTAIAGSLVLLVAMSKTLMLSKQVIPPLTAHKTYKIKLSNTPTTNLSCITIKVH